MKIEIPIPQLIADRSAIAAGLISLGWDTADEKALVNKAIEIHSEIINQTIDQLADPEPEQDGPTIITQENG